VENSKRKDLESKKSMPFIDSKKEAAAEGCLVGRHQIKVGGSSIRNMFLYKL
jgi:hypothetical protein